MTYRPPAVPLVLHDPYFSLWSFTDALTQDDTRHWTGAPQPLRGLLRVGERMFCFCGSVPFLPALAQRSVTIHPTRTDYVFDGDDGLELTLSFVTPAFLDDLDVLARPVTYVRWSVRAPGWAPSTPVALLWTADAGFTVHDDDPVTCTRVQLDGLRAVRAGSTAQSMLSRAGDDLRIEWGHLYLAARADRPGGVGFGDRDRLGRHFAETGTLPADDDLDFPRRARTPRPCGLAALFSGTTGGGATYADTLLMAYDDGYSLEWMRERLRPYWRRDGQDAAGLLRTAAREEEALVARARRYDETWEEALRARGGDDFARLGSLAYRQSIAGHKLAVASDGTPVFFSKENFSNGCVATVDITYPSAPLFLYGNPSLLRYMVEPVLRYTAGPRWRFDYAPHDLGTYPLANGQVYGGGEESDVDQMPVEECGNLLLLTAALAKFGDHLDLARAHWPRLERWAAYLREHGGDPAHQLCTDDFAGPMPRNVNLALKAVLAVGAFAQLARRLDRPDAKAHRAAAESMARDWLSRAGVDRKAGGTLLAFGAEGTWSVKYNLIWDRLLGLDLFDAELGHAEASGYVGRLMEYGLPLDSRGPDAKLDWQVWAAALSGDRRTFDRLMKPLYGWVSRTPDRVPLGDWFDAGTGRARVFRARTVVGGVFLPLLLP